MNDFLNPFPYKDDVVLLFIGGSQLHGAKLEGTDDTDWYGVFVEPPQVRLGVDRYEHFVWSSNLNGERGKNTTSDVDVCLYSLSKWANLACKGNPSVLHFLFATQKEKVCAPWAIVSVNRDLFLSKRAAEQYRGFAHAQMRRLLNQQGGKDCHRGELEAAHGYDTKYAMHIIRLYQEGIELMKDRQITLPRPNADELIRIRHGKYQLTELKDWADQLEAELDASILASSLPDSVDRQKISVVISRAHFQHWGFKGELR